MIDARRWTANERDVVRQALKTEEQRLRARARASRAQAVHTDAQWRRLIIAQALESIGPE